MKRIFWYAAATALFVSSVLAKPAHGAERTYIGTVGACSGEAGRPAECERQRKFICGASAQPAGDGEEWFPGQGPSADAEESHDGEEWFPGQGPAAGVEESRDGEEWFPGQAGDIQWPDLLLKPWWPWSSPNSWSDQNSWWNPNSWSDQNSWSSPNSWWNQNQWDNQDQGDNQNQGNHQNPWENQDHSDSSYISRIVELVNVQRAAAGLAPVSLSYELSAAADIRAREIVNQFAHYRPNGTYFNTVLNQQGISYNGAGENIAYGYDTPERVMTEWMNSPSHRANILDSRFTKLGVGFYQENGVKYWTQMFTY